ncbi:MAG: alpha/beta hydrolase family protein [Candidatus Binataceae bacterium]
MALASARGADRRCDKLVTSLGDGRFADVIAMLDPSGRGMLSTDQLKQVWTELIRGDGTLTGWKTVGRELIGDLQVRLLELSFARGQRMRATIAVNEADEVHTLLFDPMADSAPAPESPPAHVHAHAFLSEDVAIGTPPNDLAGIVTVPMTGKPPYPAAVIVGGSGPTDMNGADGAEHPYKDVAEGLSSRGIVISRYDKRTVAQKDADPTHLTIDQEYIEDAVVAITILRARQDVDPARIFIVGHSLGGFVAPDIAKHAGGIAGLVLMAPAGRGTLEAMAAQMRYLGAPADKIAQIERLDAAIKAGKLPPSMMVAGAPVGYFTDLNNRNEFTLARDLGISILVLHGGRDYQVTDIDIAMWQKALAGDPKANFKEFPGLNHLFIAGTGKPGPADYQIRSHVDERVISAVANFIAATPPSTRSQPR